MIESHTQVQEAFDELHTLPILDKIKFLEELLFYFTLTGRGIWSDDKTPDPEKINAFKWLNELSHRVWNIRSELQQDEDNDSITRIFENMNFYGGQSDLLKMHFVPTILGAFKNFNVKQ